MLEDKSYLRVRQDPVYVLISKPLPSNLPATVREASCTKAKDLELFERLEINLLLFQPRLLPQPCLYRIPCPFAPLADPAPPFLRWVWA